MIAKIALSISAFSSIAYSLYDCINVIIFPILPCGTVQGWEILLLVLD